MKTYRLRFHRYVLNKPYRVVPFIIAIEVPEDTDTADVWEIGEEMAKGMNMQFGYIED